jgi:hypothetical protein
MKTINHEGLSLETPSRFFTSMKSDLLAVKDQEVVIVFITDDNAQAVKTWPIARGWLNILEDAIEQGEIVEADSAIIIQVARREDGVLPHVAEIEDLSNGLKSNGMWIKDSFLLEGENYFSYLCSGQDCCPVDGKPILDEVAPQSGAYSYEIKQLAESTWEQLVELSGTTSATPVIASKLKGEIAKNVQNVHIRDHVLAQICQSDVLEETLIRALIDIALTSKARHTSRLAGMAAAAMYAGSYPAHEVETILELASNDSLGGLVRKGISKKYPPASLRRIFIEAVQKMDDDLTSVSKEPQPAN